MTDAEKKLDYLQHCLGEKKLKQLGLISCQTCKEILTEVININLPTALENKSFFTTEEISTINEPILSQLDHKLIETPINEVPHSINSEFVPLEQEISNNSLEENVSNTVVDLLSEENNELTTFTESTSDSYDISTNNIPLTEDDLMIKLLTILNQSHHIPQDHLGIGYIYSPPNTTIQEAHTLCCSECGRLYTLSNDPTPHLFPLPVYLTDTEYEMIKGIYVDVCL